jgi:hypothetical protein
MRHLAWLIAAALLALASACGSDSGPGISESASQELQLRVSALREASLSGDRTSVQSTLEAIRVATNDLRGNGGIDEQGATRIFSATSEIEKLIHLVPTTTTTTTTTPPPVVEDQGSDEDRGRGRGPSNDKPKGKDK